MIAQTKVVKNETDIANVMLRKTVIAIKNVMVLKIEMLIKNVMILKTEMDIKNVMGLKNVIDTKMVIKEIVIKIEMIIRIDVFEIISAVAMIIAIVIITVDAIVTETIIEAMIDVVTIITIVTEIITLTITTIGVIITIEITNPDVERDTTNAWIILKMKHVMIALKMTAKKLIRIEILKAIVKNDASLKKLTKKLRKNRKRVNPNVVIQNVWIKWIKKLKRKNMIHHQIRHLKMILVQQMIRKKENLKRR